MRALLVYGGSLVAFLALYAFLASTPLLGPWLGYNAQATGFVAGLFGASAQVAGNYVVSDSFAISIVEECTSLAPFAIFAAAIFAYPAPRSRKLLGLGLGFVALSAVNLVRIVSLFFIGMRFPSALDTAHLLVWQSLMVVAAVALWLVWMRRYAYARSP